MGLRFRKSINLGCFRVNLSKRGIGYSIGVPGFRKTFKATGGSRTTIGIPGTGLSYSKDSKKLKLKKNKYSTSNTSKSTAVNTTYIDPNRVESIMQSSTQNEFVNKLNKITSFNRRRLLWLCLSAFFIIIFVGIFFTGLAELTSEAATSDTVSGLFGCIVCLTPAVLVFIHYFKMKTIELDITMEEDITTSYNKVNTVDELLKSISVVYEMVSYDSSKKSVSTDVENLVCGKAKIVGVNSDQPFCYIQSKTVKIYFLPNIILAYQNKKWIGVDYSDLDITYQSASLFRTKKENTDSTLIREGWAYENKDGSRDKRYSPNFPGYYYNYGCIKMTSTNGLKLYMMTSNTNKGLQFKETISKYKDLLTMEEN